MRTSLTVEQAIRRGLLVVNGPVLLLLLGPSVFIGVLIARHGLSRINSWLGLFVIVGGFVLAWLWWSVSVPRWRIWAYERVQDTPALKRRAVAVGLTWPDGHVFGRTEFKSKSQTQREHELDPSNERNVAK